MKKIIGIIIVVIAVVLIVLGLKTQEAPENVAVVENTDTVDTQEDENTEKETNEEPEENTEEVGTELPVAEENTIAEENKSIEGANSFEIQENSKLFWLGKKVGGQHNGYVKISDGTVLEKDGKIVGGEITFDMTSIKATDIDNEGLENHLKNDEYFNTEANPTATLDIKDITEEGKEEIVTANFSLNGITKTISFPTTIGLEDGKATINAQFALDRTMRDINGGLPAVSKYMELTLKDLVFEAKAE